MRVVLDTNVLVSGLLFSGPPAEILRAWAQRRFTIAVSPEVQDEYEDVARRHRVESCRAHHITS